MASSIIPSSFTLNYYPYPSTVNVANFISLRLSTENYSLWKKQMYRFIENQEMLGFIDGSLTSPAVTEDQDHYHQWRRSDCLVRGWIFGSVTDDVLANLVRLNTTTTTARNVWTNLEDKFLGYYDYFDDDVDDQSHDKKAAASPKDSDRYFPVLNAIRSSDWKTVNGLLEEDRGLIVVSTKSISRTLLHFAVMESSTDFVKNLVELMTNEELAFEDRRGLTALSSVVGSGNIEVASILLKRYPDLLYIKNNKDTLPHHEAALYNQKEMFSYLLSVTKEELIPRLWQFTSHSTNHCWIYRYVGITHDLIKHYPHFAFLNQVNGNSLLKDDSPLKALARKPSVFPSGSRLSFWERFIYYCVPVNLGNYSNIRNGGNIQNPADDSQVVMKIRGIVSSVWSNYLSFGLVTDINRIQEKKVLHHQALEIGKCLCREIKSSNEENYVKFKEPVLLAASRGIHEIVEEIVDTFPHSTSYYNGKRHRILHVAIINRCEKVFSLIYQMNEHKMYLTKSKDTTGNNILHLAGLLAPIDKLNLVSGAALQMQRELQWFKVVEKLLDSEENDQNNLGMTPTMVFTKEHNDLQIEGEKWMKDTASSCSIAATLIASIVFATAYTIPGGNNGDTGHTFFLKNKVFMTFIVSDAISLFTSTTSLLIFLSILTARYAEEVFLYVLPKRLILGLLTLFLSIASMLVTFCATLFLVLGQKKAWTIVPVATIACLPITSFVTLQFPLLVTLISSTYGRGIFGKPS